jgi:hypothetical protein
VTERNRCDRHCATKAQQNPAGLDSPGTAVGYHHVTLSEKLSNAAVMRTVGPVNSEACSMHGKAKRPVSSVEEPHGGRRMAMIGDRRAQPWSLFDVARAWESTPFLPRGAVRRSDRLSPHSSSEPERMRRTLVASGERE